MRMYVSAACQDACICTAGQKIPLIMMTVHQLDSAVRAVEAHGPALYSWTKMISIYMIVGSHRWDYSCACNNMHALCWSTRPESLLMGIMAFNESGRAARADFTHPSKPSSTGQKRIETTLIDHLFL